MAEEDIELWTDRYKPRTVDDIVGQKEGIRKLCQWLDQYEEVTKAESDASAKIIAAKQELRMAKTDEAVSKAEQHLEEALDDMEKAADLHPNRKRCVLISGDSGVGKTSAAICLLESRGYQVFEFNASDVRTKTQIEESLFHLIHIKQVKSGKPVAIIMDEIDGMSGGDKGGLSEIIHYINPDRGKGNRRKADREKRVPLPPMICICNNGGERKLLDFHKDCLSISFKKPNKEDLNELLQKVCKQENILLDEGATELILEYSQEDFRRLLNYLQSLDSLIINHDQVLEANNIEELHSIIGEKTMDLGLEESVTYALTKKNISPEECLRVYSNHKSQFVCSMYENYGHILANDKKMDPLARVEIMSQIMEDIAYSDMIDKIMHKNQLWYLHKVHGLLSCYLPVTDLQCKNPVLHTSSSRSKFNQQKNNEKDIYHLSSRLKNITGTTDVHVLSQLILHYLLDEQNPDNFKTSIALLKNYGLDHKHVKTLIKIDRLTKREAKCSHRLNNMLKDELEPKVKK